MLRVEPAARAIAVAHFRSELRYAQRSAICEAVSVGQDWPLCAAASIIRQSWRQTAETIVSAEYGVPRGRILRAVPEPSWHELHLA
jgi:hypothetical protein